MIRSIIGLVSLILIFSVNEGQAQVDPSLFHKVKYRDGSIFLGQIIYKDGVNVHMLATTGDTLHLNRLLMRSMILARREKFHYNEGIFTAIEFGAIPGTSFTVQIDLVGGYRLDHKTAIGAGIGYHSNDIGFEYFWVTNNFIPVYGYVRRYLSQKRRKPFVFLKSGYGFADNNFWTGSYSGGVYAQPGIGINFASRNKFRFVLTLSEYLQYTKGTATDGWGWGWGGQDPATINYKQLYARAIIKFAMEFK